MPQGPAYAPFTPHVTVLTPTTGTVTIELAVANGRYMTHALTGNVTYAATGRGPGRTTSIRITAGASSRTLTFPAGWVFVTTKPTSIAANKTAILTVTWFDTTEASGLAAYAVQS